MLKRRTKIKLNRREEEEEPKKLIHRDDKREKLRIDRKPIEKSKLHRRSIEKVSLNRRAIGHVYCSIEETICYVCGKVIQQEFAYETKKQWVDIKNGQRKQVSTRVAYPVPPLAIGKNSDDIMLYRHRHKDACKPMSPQYMKKLIGHIPPSILRIYNKGLKIVRDRKAMATIVVYGDDDSDE